MSEEVFNKIFVKYTNSKKSSEEGISAQFEVPINEEKTQISATDIDDHLR